jgi:hypothetical protein
MGSKAVDGIDGGRRADRCLSCLGFPVDPFARLWIPLTP